MISEQPSENPQTLPDEFGTSTIRLTRLWQWALAAVVIVAMYFAVDFVASFLAFIACDALGSMCVDGEGSVSTILSKVLDDFSFVGILIFIWAAVKLLYGKRLPRLAIGNASYGLNDLLKIALLVLCIAIVFALAVRSHFRVDGTIQATSVQ